MIYAFGAARLGRDAELRYTPSGDAVANLSLAFNYGKPGEGGQRPTTWVDATLWGRRAEGLVPYLLKGTSVTVALEELHIEFYKNRDGVETPKLAGRVADIQLGTSLAPAPERYAPAQAPERPPARPPAQAARPPAPRAPAQSGFDDMSDDIPF